MGIDKSNIFVLQSGNVLELSKEQGSIIGKVKTGEIFVDGLGVGDVGNIVIRDRQVLSENGLIIVVVGIEKYSNQILSGPDVVSRGFVYVREADDLMNKIKNVARRSVEKCIDKNISDWGKIKATIKDDMGEFLWKEMKRSPLVMPIIMEINR